MKTDYPYITNSGFPYDSFVDEAQENIDLPKEEELVKAYQKYIKTANIFSPTPLVVYQLCYALAIDIINDCDGLHHIDNYENYKPTKEAIDKALYLKAILDTLTDLPCQDTIAVMLSSVEREKAIEIVKEAKIQAEEWLKMRNANK